MRHWTFAIAVAAVLAGPAQAAAQPAPGQSLGFASIPNLRDLGGYTTREGAVVRQKTLYRSDQFNPVSRDDLRRLQALNLKTAFDLRTEEERAQRPDQLPQGVAIVPLDVLAGTPQSDTAKVEQWMRTPSEANKNLGDGKAAKNFEKAYRDLVSQPGARAAYRQLFLSLADRGTLPAVVHCATGKDRTGWAAAALLTLLGVPKETVMQDFLRSNDYILPVYQRITQAFVAAGGDASIPPALFGVQPAYLEAAFDEVEKKYGSIERYFSDALGIDSATREALRANFLVPK